MFTLSLHFHYSLVRDAKRVYTPVHSLLLTFVLVDPKTTPPKNKRDLFVPPFSILLFPHLCIAISHDNRHVSPYCVRFINH